MQSWFVFGRLVLMRQIRLLMVLTGVCLTALSATPNFAVAQSAEPVSDQTATLRLGRFNVDVSPPIGTPVAYVLARSITDPLYARGIVLVGAGEPIVLCAVDYIGIGGSGQDEWKAALARAAGTVPERVCVHTLHQHDAPRCDFRAEELMTAHGLGGTRFEPVSQRAAIARVAEGVKACLGDLQPVTHIATGMGRVERVASNRRILGANGKVELVRVSSTRNPRMIEAPEGTIDPMVRLVSFWNGDQALASLSWYACHPMSFYGKGDVTSDFVGLARGKRDASLPGVLHVHFNGGGGNVSAGKYNTGTPEERVELTNRMESGLKSAWESVERFPVDVSQIEWRTRPVQLPVSKFINREEQEAILSNPEKTGPERLGAATKLAWLERNQAGEPITLACLKLGKVSLLHMPGELFVEYQLAAQKMAPDQFVCMAAYGDYSTGYIGTAIAYTQGGYETEPRSSNVSPEVEAVLMEGMKELLGVSAKSQSEAGSEK